jgi:hypothetical protein
MEEAIIAEFIWLTDLSPNKQITDLSHPFTMLDMLETSNHGNAEVSEVA